MNTTTNRTNLRNADGNWVIGTVGRFTVQAKVYEEGHADYGMAQCDRISKLWIKDGDRVVYDFDRGNVGTFAILAADLIEVLEAVTA